MSRVGVTYDQVAAVADGLIAEDIAPTNKKVRERLGTGSSGTIQRHLATWRSVCPPLAASVTELPVSIVYAISQEILRTKSEARAEIECRLVIIQAEATDLAEMCETLEAGLDERSAELTKLTLQINTLVVKIQEQTVEIDRLTREIERERFTADHARTEVAQTRINLNIQAEKLSELSATIDNQKSVITAESTGKITAEKNEAVIGAKFEAEQQKNILLESEKVTFTTQLTAEKQLAESARIEAAIKTDNLECQAAVLAQKVSEIKQLTEFYETEKNDRFAIEKIVAVLNEQLDAARKSADSVRLEVTEKTDRIHSLTDVLKQKDSEISDLSEFYETEKNARNAADMNIAALVTRLDEQDKANIHSLQ